VPIGSEKYDPDKSNDPNDGKYDYAEVVKCVHFI
jgi:hypothetical protein